MLATIPITKTSASRMTPELRDNAAFGAVFSDHMLVADFVGGKWTEPRIVPYGPQLLAAAPACAHYGQGIFEGFKAFPRPNGGAVVFRPDANHARMAKTCQRMAMPEVPASIFIDGTLALVQLDRNWIPEKDNSALYVRPVLFATGETLGVKPSESFRFVIETCPSAPYFSGSVDLIAEDTYVRAFPGGTGAAKCGGNYAGSMLASIEAQKKGFHNVLWLDGIERRYVEEAGLMNVAFVIDGAVVTPPLGGTILPGITRDSVLTLLRRSEAAGRRAPHHHRRSVRRACEGHAPGRRRHRHRRRDRAARPPAAQGSRDHDSEDGPGITADARGRRARRHPLGQDRGSPQLAGVDLAIGEQAIRRTGERANRRTGNAVFRIDVRRRRRLRQQAHAVPTGAHQGSARRARARRADHGRRARRIPRARCWSSAAPDKIDRRKLRDGTTPT